MILREEADQGLKITIIGEPGQWHVQLENHHAGLSGDGRGQDFSSAWDDIAGARVRPGYRA